MVRIGICDDSADARCVLTSMLEKIMERRAVECSIFEFSSGEGLLGWMEKHAGELDLVFLDIEMGRINGMEAAKALRKTDDTLMLVFVTGYADYVYDGYTVGALGYLMKPPKLEQLDDIISRALGLLFHEADKVFLCKNAEGLYRIPKNNILYFSSDKRKVRCVTKDRAYVFYDRLDEVAKTVGSPFVRIHQRYLVRAAAVDRVEAGNVIIGDEVLPISRSYQGTALAAIARAVLEG